MTHDDLKCAVKEALREDPPGHICSFTPEEVVIVKQGCEHGRQVRRGVVNAAIVILVAVIAAVFFIGAALTARAIVNTSPAKIIERATGLKGDDHGSNP